MWEMAGTVTPVQETARAIYSCGLVTRASRSGLDLSPQGSRLIVWDRKNGKCYGFDVLVMLSWGTVLRSSQLPLSLLEKARQLISNVCQAMID